MGAGTGWNAALLTWRTGPGRVVSVEVDDELARQAKQHLDAAGTDAAVVTADGAGGRKDRSCWGVPRSAALWRPHLAQGSANPLCAGRVWLAYQQGERGVPEVVCCLSTGLSMAPFPDVWSVGPVWTLVTDCRCPSLELRRAGSVNCFRQGAVDPVAHWL
ncbi:hypothetical protein V2J94_43485 [Streptomyces sp. DSM 41524]|uniref:Protein-L-isoaspartate O-methyltransferase n=1 Tax=Streptomyces asiaticus subsp. ignotus TaxID=3098222 RepID=A0ABU7QB40_9ACTN|nr:hypothetical protein [Streptomyces sp. DSM 41524]